jgi:hypothetical protein
MFCGFGPLSSIGLGGMFLALVFRMLIFIVLIILVNYLEIIQINATASSAYIAHGFCRKFISIHLSKV